MIKMHGLGNSCLICREMPADFAAACQQSDQLVMLDGNVMRTYNSDGSQSEICLNATRCTARLLMEESGLNEIMLETGKGEVFCWRVGDEIAVDIGLVTYGQELHLKKGPLETCHSVDAGNPHVVFFTDDAEDVDLEKWGPQVETDPLFPNRTNVEVARIDNHAHIRMRVWERGVGITAACGSGACAVQVAAHHLGLTGPKATVQMDGGSLTVDVREDGRVVQIGKAEYV